MCPRLINEVKEFVYFSVPCDNVESFQLERDSPTNIIYQSDSDEFDHFYDWMFCFYYQSGQEIVVYSFTSLLKATRSAHA